MNSLLTRTLGRVLAFAMLCVVTSVIAVDVPKYGMFETSTTNNTSYANKFRDVDLEATFTSPSGREIPFWGFFDGDGSGGPNRMDVVSNWQPDTGGEISGNVWKLRFMPNEIGTWTYTWEFSDGSKSGNGSFTCVADGARPGVLTVDTDNNARYLRNDNGPFFPKMSGMWTFVGHTYDISECHEVYDKFIAKGFNVLMQQGVLPVWPRPRFGSTHEENNGGVNDPHIMVWYQKKNHDNLIDGPTLEYAEATWDTDRMNLFTWKRIDQHLNYMAERNIYFIGWQGFNIKRTFPLMPHNFPREKYDWYTRYALARLAPYYNMTWNNTWESSNGADWLKENLQVKKYDPWRRIFYQVGGNHERYDIDAKDRSWNDLPVTSDRPVLTLESNGLWWLGGKTPLEAMQIEWKFLTSAAIALPVEYSSGVTTFANHCTHGGLDYIVLAETYIEENFEYWKPGVLGHHELVSDGGTTTFCLARPGHEYLVYREGGGAFTLNLSDASGACSVTRLNPFTGATESADTVEGGAVVNLDAPGDWHVLHVRAGAPTDTTPPSKAQNLSGNAINDSRVELNWDAASDAESGISNYKVYRGGTLIGSPGDSTFADTTTAPETTYTYTVSAVNGADLEGSASDPLDVITPAANQPPTVSITNPANESNHNAGSDLTITADAADTDGTVASVEFLVITQAGSNDEVLHETDTDASNGWSVTWTNPAAGDYDISATATDDDSATTESSAIVVHIVPPPTPGTITLPMTTADANEGDSVSVTIERNGGSDGEVSVYYETSHIDTNNSDYTAASGTLTWADGNADDKTVVIDIIDDSDQEGDEGFKVVLSSPTSGASIGNDTETITILVNDNPTNIDPVITDGPNTDPATVTLPDGIALDVTATDADGDTLNYAWSKQSGPGDVSFAAQAASTTATFNAAGSYTIEVTVTDSNGGSASGTVDVTVEAAPSGDGEIVVTGNTDFAATYVDGGTSVRTFTISNEGSGVLLIESVTLGGTDAAAFNIAADPALSIAVDSTTPIEVTFDPSSEGSKTATLTIVSDDSTDGTVVLNLTGEAFAGSDPGIPPVNDDDDGCGIASGLSLASWLPMLLMLLGVRWSRQRQN